ncbi:hypothetical protein GN956_G22201 [Arapaima gigas]
MQSQTRGPCPWVFHYLCICVYDHTGRVGVPPPGDRGSTWRRWHAHRMKHSSAASRGAFVRRKSELLSGPDLYHLLRRGGEGAKRPLEGSSATQRHSQDRSNRGAGGSQPAAVSKWLSVLEHA